MIPVVGSGSDEIVKREGLTAIAVSPSIIVGTPPGNRTPNLLIVNQPLPLSQRPISLSIRPILDIEGSTASFAASSMALLPGTTAKSGPFPIHCAGRSQSAVPTSSGFRSEMRQK